jgi:tetratricopeptide (TPR) repeat protein
MTLAPAFAVPNDLAAAENDAVLGTTEWQLGHYASAERCLTRAAREYQRVLGPRDPSLARLYQALALVLNTEQKYGPAEQMVQRAIALWGAADQVEAAKSAHLLASIQANRKRYPESAAQYRRAVFLLEQALGDRDPLLIGILADSASVLVQVKNSKEAEKLSRRAVALAETEGTARSDWARAEWALALAINAQGNELDAEQHFRNALDLFQAIPQFDAIRFAAVARDYARLLRQLHRVPEAIRLEADASAVMARQTATIAATELRQSR